jgi:hypothetical protein
VPPVSILGSALVGYGIVRVFKRSLRFVDVLFIVLLTDFICQVFENVSKLVYYLVWDYPVWLYLLVMVLLAFLAPIYFFVRWLKLPWWLALVLAIALFLGGMLLSLAFISVTGITTPDS